MSKLRSGFSDHDAVGWSTGRKRKRSTHIDRKVKRRNLDKMNEKKFQDTLAMQEWERLKMVDINRSAELFSSMVLAALNKHAQEREIEAKVKKLVGPSQSLKMLQRRIKGTQNSKF
jgi:hypothetical protein